MKHEQSYVPRGMIIFAQVFGTFFSIATMLLILAALDIEKSPINNFWIAFGMYLVWKSIYSAFYIIKFMKKSTDQEIIDNRWVIAIMSLSIGGLLTPFIITSFGNYDTRTTIAPKRELTRAFALDFLVGGAVMFATFFGLQKGNFIQGEFWLTSLIVVATLFCVVGVLGTLCFFGTQDKFKTKEGFAKVQNVISYIFIFIATLQLIWLMIISILRLFQAFTRIFSAMRSENKFLAMFEVLFALLNFAITWMYIKAVMFLAIQSLKVIWSPNDQHEFKQFTPLNEYTMQQQMKS